MRPAIHFIELNGCRLRDAFPWRAEVVDGIVRVGIGARRTGGSDDFTIRILSPQALIDRAGDGVVLATGRMLVVDHYDADLIEAWVSTTVSACEAPTWPGCLALLRRHFDWEFDYLSP